MISFEKRFLSLALSLLVAIVLLFPGTVRAENEGGKFRLSDYIISIAPSGQQLVRPDASIEIILAATEKVLKALGIKESGKSSEHMDRFGLLITDGQSHLLATERNGNAKMVYDNQAGIIRLTVPQPYLSRYTNYNVYLLTKDSLNKYKSTLKSDENSKAFLRMLEKEQDDHLLNYSFKTGSAVGEPSQWEFSGYPNGKVLASEGVVVNVSAHDDYGNQAISGKLIFAGATDLNGQLLQGITAVPTEVPLENGKAEIRVTSDKTQYAVLKFKATGPYPEDEKTFNFEAQFVKAAPAGSKVAVIVQENIDRTVTIDGVVQLNGVPVVNAGVPLKVVNGVLSDSLPITNNNGKFTTTVKNVNNAPVIVSIDSLKASQVYMPIVGIDPIIFGNQAWTDTGIDILQPNTLIRVAATGSWADRLYAKVGEYGTPVKIGANGGFVAGTSGRLYLGPYNAMYPDNVDSIITLDDPKAVGIYPTMSISANPTEVVADGKSTSNISGQVVYGQYPLVDGVVTLSATLGTITPGSPKTSDTGNYSATFIAGLTAGTATVTAQFENLTQTVNINLKLPVNAIKNEYIINNATYWFKWTRAIMQPHTLVKVEMINSPVMPSFLTEYGLYRLLRPVNSVYNLSWEGLKTNVENSMVVASTGNLELIFYYPGQYRVTIVEGAQYTLEFAFVAPKSPIYTYSGGPMPALIGISNARAIDQDGNKYKLTYIPFLVTTDFGLLDNQAQSYLKNTERLDAGVVGFYSTTPGTAHITISCEGRTATYEVNVLQQ